MIQYIMINYENEVLAMEQIYFDEIHKRGVDGKSIFLKSLIVGACVFLCPTVFILGGSFGLLLAAAVIYGAYYLFQRLNREYEYIYTGGEVDIDVIYGKAKRQRLITLKPRQIEFMGKSGQYFEKYRNQSGIQKVLDFSDGQKEGQYMVIVNSNQLKKLVLFSPSDRLVEQMKPYLRERFGE